MSRAISVPEDPRKPLLGGWIPSDQTCQAEGCCGIPLLRSPEGLLPVIWFCPNCEGDGSDRNPDPGQSEQQHPSSPSLASSTHYSRSSTPPTEESHASSSAFALPVETEESIRRRQQSDLASAEIGNRLLKGWAMLADECPRSSCYGIPLVRPPKAGRDKDPRKECVVCGTVYVTEAERTAQGLDFLALGTLSGSKQEEITTSRFPVESNTITNGKQKAYESPTAISPVVAPVPPAAGTTKVTHTETPASLATSSLFQELNLPQKTSPSHAISEPVSTSDVLASAGKALRATLSTLSQRLLLLSGQAILDPVMISQTADAIARTGQALAVINTLRHDQK
ncbi:hypothetical protein F5148DRAFT_583701 [Russula earlei]|uniref:Uncharacterized protein n=1 Tax=Russula earlei TaxID=71964 RepID=A0ACC0UFW3_9AGAM|nr:hypothetical protein F5148DRAFT_583701 [Russula earlei]